MVPMTSADMLEEGEEVDIGSLTIPLEARAQNSGNPQFLARKISSRSHCFCLDKT
jgi:hypothetical protein